MQSKNFYIAGASIALLSMVSLALQRKSHINSIHENRFFFCCSKYSSNQFSNINSLRLAYYVNQCSRSDPEVNTCLMHSANRLARLLQVGVPELGMEEVISH